MDPLVPDNIERLIPYVPGKPLEELERELGIKDAIKLASNESPIGPSPKVLAAIRDAAAIGSQRYPDGSGHMLRKDLAVHHGVSMDEVVLGNGSSELIDLICRTYATPRDHVVFGNPSFVCYALSSTAANAASTAVPLRDHLHWDIDALLAAVRPETKILFLANPNNPTGAYVSREALARLIETLPPRVVAVIDEAYVEFADAPDYESALSMRGLRERLIVLRTFSKAYGLAGLRLGYAIGKETVVGYLHRVRPPFNTCTLAQTAARVALTDPEHVTRYIELNRRERARVSEGLRALGADVAPSQANFVLAGLGRPGAEVYDRLLRMGVIVRPMPPPIDRWLRITVGLPDENDRMLTAVRELLQG